MGDDYLPLAQSRFGTHYANIEDRVNKYSGENAIKMKAIGF